MSASNDHNTQGAQQPESLLSSWELGAAYALICDDLDTCQALAQEYLARDSYSSVCYVILAQVARRRGDWLEVAEANRLALCFGAHDPQVTSLMAGLYDLIDRPYERDWICEQFNVTAEQLFSLVPRDVHESLNRMLSAPPRLPRRRSVTQYGGAPLTGVRSAHRTGHAPPPPNWLESAASLDLLSSEGLGPIPDWIVQKPCCA